MDIKIELHPVSSKVERGPDKTKTVDRYHYWVPNSRAGQP